LVENSRADAGGIEQLPLLECSGANDSAGIKFCEKSSAGSIAVSSWGTFRAFIIENYEIRLFFANGVGI
jgi:hypothetical protein